MESSVISTGSILDMEIKESQKPTSLQNWGRGEQFQVYLSIHPIIIESYHFSSMLNTLNCISMEQTVLLHFDLSEV